MRHKRWNWMDIDALSWFLDPILAILPFIFFVTATFFLRGWRHSSWVYTYCQNKIRTLTFYFPSSHLVFRWSQDSLPRTRTMAQIVLLTCGFCKMMWLKSNQIPTKTLFWVWVSLNQACQTQTTSRASNATKTDKRAAKVGQILQHIMI